MGDCWWRVRARWYRLARRAGVTWRSWRWARWRRRPKWELQLVYTAYPHEVLASRVKPDGHPRRVPPLPAEARRLAVDVAEVFLAPVYHGSLFYGSARAAQAALRAIQRERPADLTATLWAPDGGLMGSYEGEDRTRGLVAWQLELEAAARGRG